MIDKSKLPKSRRDAKLKGVTHYFSGTPCPKGHVTDRITATGRCAECDRAYRRYKTRMFQTLMRRELRRKQQQRLERAELQRDERKNKELQLAS